MAFANQTDTSWDTLFSQWLSSGDEPLELEVDSYSCSLRWERQEIVLAVSLGFGYQENPALMDGLLMLSIPSLSFFHGALAIDPSNDFFSVISILPGDVQTKEITQTLETLLNQCDVWRDQLSIRPYYKSVSLSGLSKNIPASIRSMSRQFSLSNL